MSQYRWPLQSTTHYIRVRWIGDDDDFVLPKSSASQRVTGRDNEPSRPARRTKGSGVVQPVWMDEEEMTVQRAIELSKVEGTLKQTKRLMEVVVDVELPKKKTRTSQKVRSDARKEEKEEYMHQESLVEERDPPSELQEETLYSPQASPELVKEPNKTLSSPQVSPMGSSLPSPIYSNPPLTATRLPKPKPTMNRSKTLPTRTLRLGLPRLRGSTSLHAYLYKHAV